MPTRISLRRVGASMGKLMAVPDSLAHGRTRFVGGPGFRSIGGVCAAVNRGSFVLAKICNPRKRTPVASLSTGASWRPHGLRRHAGLHQPIRRHVQGLCIRTALRQGEDAPWARMGHWAGVWLPRAALLCVRASWCTSRLGGSGHKDLHALGAGGKTS